jgi:hypothetical protein
MTLIVRPGFAYDTDASNYIDAVEAADQADTPGIGAMETAVRYAINDFVIGCKNDGVWTALKNSCILSGAKTLEGSFIDLKSCTKVLTNNNFADGTYSGSNYTTGDYNRETGLLGDGTSKYLNSNRNNNVDPQNSRHAAVFATTRNTEDTFRAYIRVVFAAEGGTQIFSGTLSKLSSRLADATSVTTTANLHSANGFFGVNRSGSTQYQARGSTTNETIAQSSVALGSANYYVFAGNNQTGPFIDLYATARLAFYSIGESLDLALLDARVSALITAFGVAIP